MIEKFNSVLIEQHIVGRTIVRIFIDRTTGRFWTSGLKNSDANSYSDLLYLRKQVEYLAEKAKTKKAKTKP